MDFKEIEEKGLLLFEYVRGSNLYGLATENSDLDRGGVFIEPLESILGYIKCPEVIGDEKNDRCWYSLGKYIELLSKSNPNIIESLYIPEDKVLYKNPLIDIILGERDKFLSKRCFKSFIGYAKGQIQKARNLKKKIVCPPGDKKKSVVEFYFYGTDDGKTRLVKDWLDEKGLDQKYIGLSKMDKMNCTYSAFYDWGAHLNSLGIETFDDLLEVCMKNIPFSLTLINHFSVKNEIDLRKVWEKYKTPFGYRGMTNEEDTTNEHRLSSIPKGERRILEISYDKDEYQRYCRVYKEWNDFKKHHNPERFNLAKEKQIDRKNACHSARLLEMGIEIAKGDGVIIDRTGRDREFLLSIKRGETGYDDLMKYLGGKEDEMKQSMENSTLQDDIDDDFLNELLIGVRKKFYDIN